MRPGISGVLVFGLVAAVTTGCAPEETKVHTPWLDDGQRELYGEGEIERQPATSEALRHRLKYRLSDR